MGVHQDGGEEGKHIPLDASPVALAMDANIRRQQRGDTLPNQPVPALTHLWRQQRAEFSKSYRA